ncbi:hypothetical protein [Algicella marina]|uniref:Lipocalin-like domain-containing protein n=1 Tax=Algicella marina TaxID=2683284 RepID=A0A6P1T3E5_9RHOB|nr:hypothetical protein [Algicella marina]QHQ36255.1 hypothetical protein GO499_14285 [Algicella marina]
MVLKRATAVAVSAAILASAPAGAHFREAVMERELLAGAWEKGPGEPCADIYPERLVLRDEGVFDAPGAADGGKIWHSGDWVLEGARLKMQAANDAMLNYRLEVEGPDEIVITSDDGCRVIYRRAE